MLIGSNPSANEFHQEVYTNVDSIQPNVEPFVQEDYMNMDGIKPAPQPTQEAYLSMDGLKQEHDAFPKLLDHVQQPEQEEYLNMSETRPKPTEQEEYENMEALHQQLKVGKSGKPRKEPPPLVAKRAKPEETQRKRTVKDALSQPVPKHVQQSSDRPNHDYYNTTANQNKYYNVFQQQ